jgi:iron complex outermembrane receptor protein
VRGRRIRTTGYARCLLYLTPIVCSGALADEIATNLGLVNVTAQRRQEQLQEVPLSVSVMSGGALERDGVRTLSDMGALAPALITTDAMNYGTAPLALRGVGGANGGGNIFADEPVALYVNEVPLNKVWATTTDLLDVDSVQVVRGPQGTLYGRNSSGGAVLVTTAAPTSAWEGYVRGSSDTIERSRVQGVLSGPLCERWSGRVAAGYTDDRGWATNVVDGNRLGAERQEALRASLRWKASDATTADLVVDRQISDSRPVSFAVADLSQLANPAPPNLVTPGVARADLGTVLDGHHFAYNVPTVTRIRATSSSLNLRHQDGAYMLTSISGWQKSTLSGQQDSDGSALNVIDNSGHLADEDWSQEVRLAKGAGRWTWLTGAYFSRQRSDVEAFTIHNQFAFLGAGTAARFDPEQRVSSWALFADETFAITHRVSLTFGGRFSRDSKRFHNHVVVSTLRGVTAPSGVLAPVPVKVPAGAVLSGPTDVRFSQAWQDFSPRAVLSAQFARGLLGYVSYSDGYKSGGFNAFGTTPAFRPEHVKAAEMGLKISSASERAALNASVFHYDYSDLQVRLPVPTGGIDIRNAAKANIAGAEIDAVAPLFYAFALHAGLAWLHARFARGSLPTVPATFAFGLPTALLTEDIRGNRLSRAPDWQLNFSVEYSHPLSDRRRFFASARCRAQSEEWFLETDQASQTYRGRGWSEVDVQLGLTGRDGRWEIALAGQNITDDRHVSQVASYSGLPVASLNQPASWGVQLRVNL